MAELEGTRNGTIAAPAMAGAADAASRRSSFNPNEIAEMERNDRRDGWLLAIFALAALGSAALAFVFFSGEMDQNDSYLREQGEEEAVVDRPFIWGSAGCSSPMDITFSPAESVAHPTSALTQ